MSKPLYLFCLIIALFSKDISGKMSIGMHGLQSLIGNYGATFSLRVNPHISFTMPLEIYSFEKSILGSLAVSKISNLKKYGNLKNIRFLSMLHLKAGFGLRFFLYPEAMSSGFYVEPMIFVGLLRNTDYSDVAFKDHLDVISSFASTFRNGLPKKNHFAFSPQINFGYQWVTSSNLFLQFATFFSYVFANGVDSVFNASDRYFASHVINKKLKPKALQGTINMVRAFGTQANGWHAGITMNIGYVF